MTFGRFSPGFDPFWCPPCPDGNVCNSMCFDPIDGPILVIGLLAVTAMVSVGVSANYTEKGTTERGDGQ